MSQPRTGIRLPFGPATLAAAALAVVLGRQMPLPEPAARAPRLSRTRVDVPTSGPLSPPEPAWLIQRADALELTRPQRDGLARLERRWRRETQGLQAELGRESEAFRSSSDAVSGRPAGLRELQERAGPMSLLSGQLLSARQAWWSEAARELSSTQRQRAERLWAARFTRQSTPEARLR